MVKLWSFMLHKFKYSKSQRFELTIATLIIKAQISFQIKASFFLLGIETK